MTIPRTLAIGAALAAAALAVASALGAAAGIALALAQPLLVHAGCTLCLTSTVVSVALAAGALAEARRRWPAGRIRTAPDESARSSPGPAR